MDGIVLINKEKGMTSREVVDKVGNYFHTKKVGHTGTLDPMAEGLLMVCIGKCTKLVDLLMADQKEYIAEVTLGISTDTLDQEGTVLEEQEVHKTKEEMEQVLSSMVGSYMQEVPIYSAIKKDGKKLYEYARQGKEVELPKREVTIFSLQLASDIRYENGKTIFSIETVVSKGTYIRSLVRDIAYQLGTIGMMSALTRTKIGRFSLKEAVLLKDLKDASVLSSKEVLKDYPTVQVDAYLEEKINHGAILENRYEKLPVLFLNDKGEALALYDVYEKEKNKIKPKKML